MYFIILNFTQFLLPELLCILLKWGVIRLDYFQLYVCSARKCYISTGESWFRGCVYIYMDLLQFSRAYVPILEPTWETEAADAAAQWDESEFQY